MSPHQQTSSPTIASHSPPADQACTAAPQSAAQPHHSAPSEIAPDETAAHHHHPSSSLLGRTAPASRSDKPLPSLHSPRDRSSVRHRAPHTQSRPAPSANPATASREPPSSPPSQTAAPSCTGEYPDSSGDSTPPHRQTAPCPPRCTGAPTPSQSACTTHESTPPPRPPPWAAAPSNPPQPPPVTPQIAHCATQTANTTSPTVPPPSSQLPSRNLFATRGCSVCRSSKVRKSIVLKSRSIAGSLQIFAPIVR